MLAKRALLIGTVRLWTDRPAFASRRHPAWLSWLRRGMGSVSEQMWLDTNKISRSLVCGADGVV